VFSAGIERALEVAVLAHEGQTRKNSGAMPYFIHPVHVAMMLARLGLDAVSIQAGILHDVVEDCDDWTLDRIEEEFGSEVRSVVDDLSEDKSLSWSERKRWAVEHVPHMSERAVTVKAADKLHNLSCLLRDLQSTDDRDELWSHFKGGRERTLEMSAELVEALAGRVEPRLATALREVMTSLQAL
jgi:(p)ppGpp synthase/HD superfamily hydrolase